MGQLIHLNGAPGLGKLTIARQMAPRLNARVLDNHAIYNVAFALTEFRSPSFYDAVRASRAAAYEQVLRLADYETVIFTDAYFDDSSWGWESWEAIDHLADQLRWPFFSIALVCEAAEHRRRIVSAERAGRGKLQDASYVDRVVTRRLIERTGDLSKRLDVTDLSADAAASILADWVTATTSRPDRNVTTAEHRLSSIVAASPVLSTILDRWEFVALPDCWLSGSAIAQTAWNAAFGLSPEYGLADLDLVYFDDDDLSEEGEAREAARIRGLFPDLPIWIDAKNEARVHHWYEAKFGYPIIPYRSSEHAISTFPTTAGAVAIRPNGAGLSIFAPFGLHDLLSCTVRPNKAQITQAIYDAKVARWPRDQMLLLPASVDDYVAADNPVRFIAAFVDDLDLGELGFDRSRPKATGRPGYDPADLLKLYLYGYLNRVRSSRCLAAETARNLEVIWLLGGLRPDFRTIADFRRANRASFKPLFRSFVLLCRRLDLFGRELVAVDGTRLKAVNSRKRNFTRQKLAGWIKLADERIEEYLARLDLADRAEAEAEGAARRAAALEAKITRMRERRELHSAMLADLIASGESQLSLTDPDARGMATHPKVSVGYNAQVAVDARHKLIVEQYVTNSGSDLGFLAQTASAAREVLGVEQIEAVADKGYYKGEDIAACEDVGVVPYVVRPQRGPAINEGYFAKSEFRYDALDDCYICPGNQRLIPYSRSQKNGHVTIRYANTRACQTCALRPQCASGKKRTIDRWEGEAVLERMAERLAVRPDILDRRRETVEHPFGTIKHWMNQGAFLMRGLSNVNAEFSLTALAYNLRRIINILGVSVLLRAVQA